MRVFQRGGTDYLVETDQKKAYVIRVNQGKVFPVKSVDQILRAGYCEPIEATPKQIKEFEELIAKRERNQ